MTMTITMTMTMTCLIISLNSSDDLSPLAAFVSICFCRLSLSAWPRNQKLYKYWWDWYFWKNVESLSKEQTWNVFQTCLSWISLASLSLRSPHSLSNLSLSSAVSRALQAVRNLNFWPELCYRLRKCADAIYLHFILYLLLPSPFRCFLVQTTSQIVIVCQEQEEDLMSWLLTLFAETVLFFFVSFKNLLNLLWSINNLLSGLLIVGECKRHLYHWKVWRKGVTICNYHDVSMIWWSLSIQDDRCTSKPFLHPQSR